MADRRVPYDAERPRLSTGRGQNQAAADCLLPGDPMKSLSGALAAPFPYFGGKSMACGTVWAAFGNVKNYVEPFCGSAAMLLGAPDGKRIETVNDADGFIANFWRAVAHDPDGVAAAADWPCNEVDLFARHSWLVRARDGLTDRLHGDPEYYDAKIAGWWCWGACNWIGSGWCDGTGPWVHNGEKIVDRRVTGDAGQGINRKLPHLGDAGKGILEWMLALQNRLRRVRVTCGDWRRVCEDSVTVRHGMTAVFLDPPYTAGDMDYSIASTDGVLAREVGDWCRDNGENPQLRIVLCGHTGEHDLPGWSVRSWKGRKGYALRDDSLANVEAETIWCSPACIPEVIAQGGLF